jgi:hypothetical protein
MEQFRLSRREPSSLRPARLDSRQRSRLPSRRRTFHAIREPQFSKLRKVPWLPICFGTACLATSLPGAAASTNSPIPNINVEFDINAPVESPNKNLADEVQEVTQTSTPQIVWKLDFTPAGENAIEPIACPVSILGSLGRTDAFLHTKSTETNHHAQALASYSFGYVWQDNLVNNLLNSPILWYIGSGARSGLLDGIQGQYI